MFEPVGKWTDQFAAWPTRELIGIAWRVTPRYEVDRWVATTDDATWRPGADEYGPTFDLMARNDETGRMDVVRTYPEADLRDFVVEQLEHYGTTLKDVNFMKS